MAELASCEGSISGEHLISHSIMRLLQGDGDFTISGLPWLAPGETKVIAPKSLTANCLCRKHNSALSPLDAAALHFFTALKSGLEQDAGSNDYIVSGHDIERWLLKTLKVLATSKNLARAGERLPGDFERNVAVLEMLDDHLAWPAGAGLYGAMNEGSHTENNSRFQLQPYTNTNQEIVGIWINILGLMFVLLLRDPELVAPELQGTDFRPGEIVVSHPSGTNRIGICWEDGRSHRQLALQFSRPA